MCRKTPAKAAIAAVSALFLAGAAPAVEIDPGALTPELISSSTLVPVLPFAYRLRFPGGAETYLMQAPSEQTTFVGDWPWTASGRFGGATFVRTNPAYKSRDGKVYGGEAIDILYKGGVPVYCKIGGVETPDLAAKPEMRALDDLWPDSYTAEEKEYREKRSDIWQDAGRMRFGWFDPNLSALILLQLALAGFGLALCVRWKRFGILAGVVGVAGALAATAMLMATQSRGGFLGLVAGAACLVVPRIGALFSKKGILIALAACAAIAALLFASGAGERLTSRLVARDESSEYRLNVWRAAPRMMVDAPGGWGLGRSGDAYMRWYQGVSENILQGRSLFNTHLTWLAELGWPWRFAYVFGWTLLLGVLGGLAIRTKRCVPLAVWTGTGVAATFVTAASIAFWALPFLALVAVLPRILRMRKLFCWAGGAALVVAIAAIAGFYASGMSAGDSGVRRVGNVVVVNGDEPEAWVVDDGWVLDSGRFGCVGKELRGVLSSVPLSPCVGYVESLDDLPRDARKVLFAGRRAGEFLGKRDEFAALEAVIFISPDFDAGEVPEDLAKKLSLHMYQGALAAPARDDLEWLTRVEGTELYLPGWPLTLFKF